MAAMTKTEPYSLRHQAQRSAKKADHAEFLAIKNGSTVVDVGVYDERVAGAMDDFEAQDISAKETWHSDDLKYDNAVGQIHEEVECRSGIMGSAYPFLLSGGSITYVPSENSIYEFLLSICNATTLTEGEYVCLPRIFERLSARLVAVYFGKDTQFIHTGAPRDAEIGLSFKDAMSTVAARTGEWRWGPDDGLPENPSQRDAGCDFVVWPNPPDGCKIGQLFILGQCACGNNWLTKFNDLSIKNLQKWFNPLSTVDPVRCFTTPFHVTDGMLIEASRQSGFVFDRARLVRVGQHLAERAIEPEIVNRMKELVKLVKA